MLWKLFQLSIMAAVMCGNIYYSWTPNPYLVGLLGLGAAFIATWILVGLGSLVRRCRPQRPDYSSSHHKRTVGARWDPDYLAQSGTGIRTGEDAGKLVEIAPERPSLERIIREAHPLSGTRALGGKRSQPRIGH